MANTLQPQLLTDKTRLQEIYNLRVEAYEQSPHSEFVNRELYPDGWSDFLDDDSFHYIVEADNKIVASARLSVLHRFQDFIDLGNDADESLIPPERPFAFISRLVILPQYRGMGLPFQLERIRIERMRELALSFGLADCRDDRLESLLKRGFVKVGNVFDTQNPKPETLHLIIIKKPFFYNR